MSPQLAPFGGLHLCRITRTHSRQIIPRSYREAAPMLWPFLHWLAIHTGAENEPGVYYGFWSGFGSDLGEFAILAGLYQIWRKHNCHVKGCWRVARHPVDGTPWIVCRKHHPHIDSAPTAGQVAKEAKQ